MLGISARQSAALQPFTVGTKFDLATAGSPSVVAIGDLNGDGKPDLVVANTGSGTVSVLVGNGAGNLAGSMVSRETEDQIGRNESHGCIRIANWAAFLLTQLVEKGTAVEVRD